MQLRPWYWCDRKDVTKPPCAWSLINQRAFVHEESRERYAMTPMSPGTPRRVGPHVIVSSLTSDASGNGLKTVQMILHNVFPKLKWLPQWAAHGRLKIKGTLQPRR